MNRSLTVFTVAFLTGIVLVVSKVSLFFFIAGALCIFAGALFVYLKFKRAVAFLILLGMLFGAASTALYDKGCIKIKEGAVENLRGVVLLAEEKQGSSRLTLYSEKYRQKLALTVYGNKKFKANDIIEVEKAVLEEPSGKMNEGAFDYRKYYKSLKINYVASVSSDKVKIKGSGGLPVFRQAREIKEKLSRRIEKVFGKGDIAGVLGGIFLGNKNLVSKETEGYMQRAGLSHLMSVSGLHVMLVVSACYMFLGSVKVGENLERIIILLVVAAFALITGMSASVLRAGLMIVLSFSALLVGRDNDRITTLSLVALILSVFNPYVIFNTGFQMSFLATLGIVTCAQPLSRFFEKYMPEAIAASAAVSLSAQIGIFPVMLSVNGYITLLTVAANLVVVPLLPFLYLFGGLALLVGGNPFAFITRKILEFIIFMAKRVALVDFNQMYFPGGIVTVIAATVVALSLLYVLSGTKRAKRGMAILFFGMVFFFASVGASLMPPSDFTVTFLNVGHGDCALIRNPNGNNMLVDTGTESMSRSQVVPYLNRNGIKSLECVVVSHFDDDHVGGLETILGRFKVKKVIAPDVTGKEEIADLCKKYEVEPSFVHKGSFFNNCGAEFYVLSPQKNSQESSNDSSIIMKMVYNNISWLFTGDASLDVLANTEIAETDILKVSHHGDKKCISRKLLETINPKVSVISAGGIGGNGADEEVVSLLSSKSELYTTYEHKTVHLICDKNGGIYFGKNKKPVKIGSLEKSLPLHRR